MPVYEYKCPNGHLFELFHGIHEPEPEACPECGEGPVTRVLHPVAVHFKGSGFYSTDYAGNKMQEAGATDSKDGGSKSSDKKSESKSSDSGSGESSKAKSGSSD